MSLAGRVATRLQQSMRKAVNTTRSFAVRSTLLPLVYAPRLRSLAARAPASRPRALVLRFRFRNGNPSLGPSLGEDYLMTCLRAGGGVELEEYFFDIDFRGGLVAEASLIERVRRQPPDLIVLSSYDCFSRRFPEFAVLRAVRDALSVPMIAVWWDSTTWRAADRLHHMQDALDLNVMIESSYLAETVRDPSRFVRLWSPVDPAPFLPDARPRDIPVSFVGLTGDYRDVRRPFLQHLAANGIPVYVAGETLRQLVPFEQYAETMRRSRICLNFSHSVEGTHQFKGRVLEALFAGALLIENTNPETTQFFVPGRHFVAFTDKADLADKVRYYLEHEEERSAIARAGHEHAMRHFGHAAFWQRLAPRLRDLGLRVPQTLTESV